MGGWVRGNSVEPERNGDANFNQTGGENLVSGDLTIGAHRNTSGRYDFDGGILNVVGNLNINESTPGVGVRGEFEQTGGSAHITGDVVNNHFLTIENGEFATDGSIINNRFLYISDTARVTTGSDTLINYGEVNIGGPDVQIRGSVENHAEFHMVDTTVTFADTLTNHGVLTSSGSVSAFGGLIVTEDGYIAAGLGDRFEVVGDFDNRSVQPHLWNTLDATLDFAGDFEHLFGLAGDDLGANLVGFQDNFAWGEVSLALGESLTLMDANLLNDTALYVGLFSLEDLEQLDSIFSAYNIYYDARLSGNDYLGGQTYNLNGSGRLIGVVPEPDSLAFLALVTAVCFLGRHRNSSKTRHAGEVFAAAKNGPFFRSHQWGNLRRCCWAHAERNLQMGIRLQ